MSKDISTLHLTDSAFRPKTLRQLLITLPLMKGLSDQELESLDVKERMLQEIDELRRALIKAPRVGVRKSRGGGIYATFTKR